MADPIPAEQTTALSLAKAEIDRFRGFLREYPDVCIYCAAGAETKDHLIPRPWWGETERSLVPTVPACSDCNVRINSAFAFTIVERAAHVADQLRRKWRKKLEVEDHPQEWFKQFGKTLRRNLERAQAERKFIRHRLDVLDCGGAPFHPDFTLSEIA